MATFVVRLFRDQQGQDLVEYALLTAVIGFAGLAVFGVLLDAMRNVRSSRRVREQPLGSLRSRNGRILTLPMWVSTAVALAACVTDLRSRRVPNVLTLGAAAAALAFHTVAGGGSGFFVAALGWVLGLLVFLPLFALRGIGGGDVKLLAALGAWLGPSMVLWVAAFAAIAGGVLALIVSAMHGYTRQAFSNVWGLLSYWRVMGVTTHPGLTLDAKTTAPRLPYALPMAAGLGITLWLR